MQKLLTVKDVAIFLGITAQTVYALIRRGEFPEGHKIGFARRWKVEEINEWLDENRMEVSQ